MDFYCRFCNEPWDNDCFHEEASESDRTYAQVARDFSSKGCSALETAFGPASCSPSQGVTRRGHVQDAMFDLMGEDTDGVAAMMEDFEYMGMLD